MPMIARKCPRVLRSRPGQALAMVALMLIGLLAVLALAVDLGNAFQVRTGLQSMADASALAAAQELPDGVKAKQVAVQVANINYPSDSAIVDASEVVVGNWDGMGTFTPAGFPVNAVRVVARRTVARGNPVPTFFAKALGFFNSNVVTYATATSGGGGAAVPTVNRFIIDEEILKDPAKKDLENIAAAMVPPRDYDWISRDNDGDWFIDIPPQTMLWVPTGQTGDEALFDMSHDAFPFADGSNGNPTFEDFLNYNEDSNSWRYDLISKNELDPLLGVNRVSHAHAYPEILGPLLGKCQVSPMYKSDVSALNPRNGVPAVNALGWRLGLLAFSIEEIGGPPPGGSSSALPMIRIKVWDPAQCNVTWDGERVVLQYASDQPLHLVQ